MRSGARGLLHAPPLLSRTASCPLNQILQSTDRREQREAEVSEAAQKPVQARQKHNDAAAAESTSAQHELAAELHAAAPGPG
jgi:hypothetical protein